MKKPILTVLKAKGHSADTGAGKFPLVSMGGRAEGLACADPGARTPISASGNYLGFFLCHREYNGILLIHGLYSQCRPCKWFLTTHLGDKQSRVLLDIFHTI